MLVDFGSRIVNTDHIVGAEPVEARAGSGWRLTLTHGDPVTIKGMVPALDGLCGIIVPALPGFVLVEAFLPGLTAGDEEIVYRESTILAFRVAPGPTPPLPITIEGEAVTHEDLLFAVVDPNGRCVSAATPYGSLVEFKATCARTVARRANWGGGPTASAASAEQAAPGRFLSLPPADADVEPLFDIEPLEDGGASCTCLRPARKAQLTPLQASLDRQRDHETTPLLALRARIQAEPIKAPFADAPWQPGRDSIAMIDELIAKHTTLHVNGIGSPKPDRMWELGAMERERAVMMSPSNVEAFEAALRFLSHAGREFARPRVNRKRTSYSWKHAAERVMGVYVPNGMLIAAAYALGFTVEPGKESSNAWINLAEEAIALDPGNGMT